MGRKSHKLKGKLFILNTIEKLYELDRNVIAETIKKQAKQALKPGNLQQFEQALEFRVYVYADLKKHHYSYQIIYPSFITAVFPYQILSQNEPSSIDSLDFVDSSGTTGKEHEIVVGWPLRNLLIWNFNLHLDKTNAIDVNLISGVGKERQVRIFCPIPFTLGAVTGWERNEQGQLAPRMINLAPLLDSASVARQATELNLRLIKWRLLPELDLTRLFKERALLLGAGTLGCNIARLLLGWGVRKITLVDNGRIAASNPARQTLFRWDDIGKPKAITAAAHLCEIVPCSNDEIRGVELSIPMPGHRIDDPLVTRQAIEQLKQLIKEHDVIFLLTDSRESRWLPTVLGAIDQEKLVITVALGFDSWVVLRHGTFKENNESNGKNDNHMTLVKPVDTPLASLGNDQTPATSPLGNGLACYFCSDAKGPQNTLAQRTLDQQCTVSRPGVSMVAAGWAIELWSSIRQHPQGLHAPSILSEELTQSMGVAQGGSHLGAVPHQIRGYMSHFGMMQLTGMASTQCTACSESIKRAVKEGGTEEVMRMMEDPDRMMQVSGAADIISKARDESINAWNEVLIFDSDEELDGFAKTNVEA